MATQTGELTGEALMSELDRLRGERDAALAKAQAASAPRAERGISFRVGEKGGVSLYGLGRFPVTLYREQWERLLAPETIDALLQFIKTNEDRLKVKGS